LPAAVGPEARGRLQALADTGDLPGMLAFCQANGLLPAGLGLEDARRHLEVRHGLALAAARHVPAAITIPVAYFCAQDETRVDPTQGWGEALGERLQLRPTPGGHHGMVAAPNARALAREIDTFLGRTATPALPCEEHLYVPRITIQGGRAGAVPVFCVPGAGASVTVFTHLAQALGPNVPLHGLQPRGLCGTLMPYLDVPSAARAYVETIRDGVPHGPFHLVGHSYGGWVACEIARQMAEQGRPPASLIVLDSHAPTSPRVPQHFHTRVEILQKLVSLFDLHLAQPLGLRAADFEPLDPEQQLKLLLSRLVEARLMPARTSVQALRGIVHVFARNLNADYKPEQPYAGRLHLAVATGSPVRGTDPREQALVAASGWRAHAAQANVWHAPGNHLTLLAPPHVEALAAWMRPLLLAAEQHA
jgi:thioesterase domain-containing protein